MSDEPESVRRNQEQAVAAWINHLNQLRLDGLLDALRRQDMNLRDALSRVDAAMRTIDLEVVARNRGGIKGMHGFIAEAAESGIGDARSQILGEGRIYRWVNDNGPVDLMRGGVEIQQKFVAAGGRFGLGAIAEHLERYPDFVSRGGRYQIPSDHFEVIRTLYGMNREEAGRLLSRGGEGPSFRDWERVQSFFANRSLDIGSLEPSNLRYDEVQRGAYGTTLEGEKDSLRATDQTRRDDAHRASMPGAREGAKATIVAAGIEGGTAFVLAVVRKRRAGTRLADFTSDDWVEIAGDSGRGFVKGGVRGLTIYSLTNFTATSAAVASATVTAAFGVAEQAHRLRTGEIVEAEFLENAELVCLEAAVGALSSFVGQALIPVPVLGAVIGNSVGMVMHSAVSSALSRREAALIEGYLQEQRQLDERLADEHQDLIDELDVSMSACLRVLERAFSPDVEAALLGSVELARSVGVETELILDSEEKVRSYFLD
ncbi:hypothetical protein [Clavibacter zhangzhiyongii]|uniref:Uncharacterized protein n=1 Tax=Clavibacter zhangzhiyongii TaxID=2768071 RepID=A0A7L7Z0S2_9MICO|nr:hypothetical protein [Clavibacter zhangzhiyongii]QOD43267.1 hypothetical protein H9X71_11775 [Clavibacter zhangzhiyongii]